MARDAFMLFRIRNFFLRNIILTTRMAGPKPACKNLVLDAGPLLTLTPLRGVAERYLTVPHVLSELKDKNAREHFERLGLMAGVKVEVLEPDAASLSQGKH